MYRLPRALTLRSRPQSLHIFQHHPPSALRTRTQLIRQPRIQQRRWKSSQVLYRSDGEPLRYQAVRFKKPPYFSMRRLFTFSLYAGVVYTYLSMFWRQMDIEIEFVEDEENQTQEQAEEVAEEEETSMLEEGPMYASDDSTFIPLTWSKKLPRTYYKGSDPEWQEFIRIAKNPSLHKAIQSELVQIVFTGCTQHPSISRQLGTNVQVGKYWLDISFPDGPPQEYERSGIEIGDGFVAWSNQKLDAEKQWRVQRALVPKAAAEGVWKSTKVLVGIQWRRVKQGLGLEGRDPGSPEERYRMAVEMQRQAESAQHGGRQVGKAQLEADVASNTSASQQQQQQQQQPSRQTTSSSSTSDAKSRKDLPWHIPTVPLPTGSNPFSTSPNSSSPTTTTSTPPADLTPSSLPIALHVFSATLSKSWNPSPSRAEPPRGAFVVQGLVEVRGSKGRMLFDVVSAYDPRGAKDEKGGGGGKFVNVNAGVRGYKRWRQSPRGGP